MGRKRVPKGQIIQKKDQKIQQVLQNLSDGYSEQDFVGKFRELFPKDWGNIVRRYDAHERLTKPGKSHPMAPPEKYLKNALKAFLLRQNRAGTPATPASDGTE